MWGGVVEIFWRSPQLAERPGDGSSALTNPILNTFLDPHSCGIM